MKKTLAILIFIIVQGFGVTTPSQVEPITSVVSEIQTEMVENENNSKLYRKKLAMIKTSEEEGRFLCIVSGFSTILNGIFTYMLWNSNDRSTLTNLGIVFTGMLTFGSAIACVINGIGLVMDHIAEEKLMTQMKSLQKMN